MIKKIITGGCSFSDPEFAWDRQLKEYTSQNGYEIEFSFLGLGSQGNELIQKKVSLELSESLKNYKASEIAVIVMWSGTERKSFYYNNPDEISKLVNFWNKNNQNWGKQFFDLKNSVGNDPKPFGPNGGGNVYNPNEGWANFNFLFNSTGLADLYFISTINNIHAVHVTLENIIFLQNLCKAHKIQFFQQFYRSYVFEDMFNNKDHQLNGYLYDFLDMSSIVSKIGLYEYLKSVDKKIEKKHRWNFLFEPTLKHPYFLEDGVHPNREGHLKWTNEVLIPFLQDKIL